MKIGILDYGAGNLRSVINAFAAVHHDAVLVTEPDQFAEINLLVSPGQGSFGDCVRQLQKTGLWEPLREWLQNRRPYFGICLGYQLLFDDSEESPGVSGLGIFRGHVKQFTPSPALKVPHMGWNTVRFADAASPLWSGMGGEETFYFVHSYYPEPEDEGIKACLTDYDGEFVSGVAAENLLAVQFHPEKSQNAGLALLSNVLKHFSTQPAHAEPSPLVS